MGDNTVVMRDQADERNIETAEDVAEKIPSAR